MNFDWLNIITQFGFAGLISAFFFFLLRWVLKTQSEILSSAKQERDQWWKNILEERDKWQRSVEMFKESLEKHTQAINILCSENSEAHKYQKTEHETLINTSKEVCNMLKDINFTLKERK